MTRLNIENLTAGYANQLVLNGLNLDVKKGEMIALLGPSGCGKTTLLNVLCGFIPVTDGRIYVGEKDLSRVAPEKRNMTLVFQSYALCPHMTVAQNIGYGLKVQKVPAIERQKRITELLDTVNLAGLENKPVTSLSGGQRQRVALARALAIRPDVLLLDEPLSNLDAKVRLSVRHEIKALQKRLGFTSLIVTHDQEEALVMADRIAVLNKGKIEQIGTPQEIYNHPKTAFVADFMGADNKINLTQYQAGMTDSTENKSVLSGMAYFRSEVVEVSLGIQAPSLAPNTGLVLTGCIEQSAFLGNRYRISVRCGEQIINAHHGLNLPEQTKVSLRVPPHAFHVFEHVGQDY